MSVSKLFFRGRPELPLILSSELAECGVACMAMIASFHGHKVDLNSIRQRFSSSLSGTSLRGLLKLADALKLSGRALRVEMGALDQVQLPAILHWDTDHYVVLKSISDSHAVIHDPARGKVTVSLKDLSNHFSGVTLELTPAEDFEASDDRIRFKLRDFFTNLRGHRFAIFYVVALTLALQVMSLLLPLQLQLIVDKAIDGNDSNILLIIAVAFASLMILTSVISLLRDWTLVLLGSQFVYQISGNLFRRLLRLPSSFFEKRHLGDVLSRLGSTRQIQDAVSQGLLSAFIDGPMIILAGTALVLYSPSIAAIIFVTVLLYVIVTVASYPFISAQTERSIAASAVEQSYLMESIRGIVPVKLMGGESTRESRWRNLFSLTFNESVALSRIRLKFRFLEEALFGFQQILILYIAARLIIGGSEFSIGMMFALLAFRNTFMERVMNLVQRGLQYGMLKIYLHRLGDFLTEEPEIAPGIESAGEITGKIALENVSFRYGATDPLVLNGINLEITPGEFLAITGRTGGGKTTLLKLLLGLQKPTEGAIVLNGQSATPALWPAWRAAVGVVRQDDQLFSGTLAENICFFDPEIDMKRVQDAAIAALVHDEIDRMPAKYQTLVGDMGSSLSGGQKQRVLLARALYRSPRILILDEGTANLDPATEERLATMIAGLEITRIVVAHRPALIDCASRVIRVEDGKLEIVAERAPSVRSLGYRSA